MIWLKYSWNLLMCWCHSHLFVTNQLNISKFLPPQINIFLFIMLHASFSSCLWRSQELEILPSLSKPDGTFLRPFSSSTAHFDKARQACTNTLQFVAGNFRYRLCNLRLFSWQFLNDKARPIWVASWVSWSKEATLHLSTRK